MSKKYYIALDDYERGTIINCLNEKRNKLIADGKYTDAVDEVLLKVIICSLVLSVYADGYFLFDCFYFISEHGGLNVFFFVIHLLLLLF